MASFSSAGVESWLHAISWNAPPKPSGLGGSVSSTLVVDRRACCLGPGCGGRPGALGGRDEARAWRAGVRQLHDRHPAHALHTAGAAETRRRPAGARHAAGRGETRRARDSARAQGATRRGHPFPPSCYRRPWLRSCRSGRPHRRCRPVLRQRCRPFRRVALLLSPHPSAASSVTTSAPQ